MQGMRSLWPISYAKRGGVGPAQVDIFDLTAGDTQADPADALCIFNFNPLGAGTASGVSSWTWLLSGVNSDYEVRMTRISGIETSGDPPGVWLVMSSTRTWRKGQTTVGTATCTLRLEIRRVSDSAVIDTADIILNATVT